MGILLVLASTMVGLAWFGTGGGLFGLLVGLLAAEVLRLRQRLTRLENRLSLEQETPAGRPAARAVKEAFASRPQAQGGMGPDGAPVKASSPGARPAPSTVPGADVLVGGSPAAGAEGETVVFTPVEEGSRPAAGRPQPMAGSAPSSSALDRFFARIGHNGSAVLGLAKRFFTTGNVVQKCGVLVLFCGIGFLINYASQRQLLSFELRLAGAAALGLALLLVGWRLRRARAAYALVLQGAGVGVLYLVVFGAAKFSLVLPLPVAFALMVALVAFSCLLALLQDARFLALFGSIGGFLAPVLVSTGAGDHVALFSYYLLLNLGIFAIAWKKSWRELNLVGFLFTFAIATLWGTVAYQPRHFATTEPFLVAFFLFYLLIAVLFALRQPVNLRGLVDGPLVFGLPLWFSALQYALVAEMEMGLAFSALALGLLYLLLAALLWRRFQGALRLLCEAFLALGVVFASLAVPLALDGQWSAAIWAMEGAGLVWVGARQGRLLPRLFGILLQLAAALIFVDDVLYPLGALPLANHYFIGCGLLSLAGLASALVCDRYGERLTRWERYLPLPLLVWGLFWWYVGGFEELQRHVPRPSRWHGLVLFSSVSAMLAAMASVRLAWPRLTLALLPHLPVLIAVFVLTLAGFAPTSRPLAGWGLAAWAVAVTVQYRLLLLHGHQWPRMAEQLWHAASLWLLLGLLSHEAAWQVARIPWLAPAWSWSCWVLLPAATLFALPALVDRGRWPAAALPRIYLGIGSLVPALAMLLWLFGSFTVSGRPTPLPYVPLLNPLELAALLVIFTVLRCGRRSLGLFARLEPMGARALYALVAGLLFLLANVVVARLVHVYGGVPYDGTALYHSAVFQAAIAALWGLTALAVTVVSTRRGSRPLWAVGAALLALVVAKLFLVDLSSTGTVGRIVSFLVVGMLMLLIGYFSPLPPKSGEEGQ